MWIKNKKTGVLWEINDKAHQEALLRDPDYIESRKSEAKKKEAKKED